MNQFVEQLKFMKCSFARIDEVKFARCLGGSDKIGINLSMPESVCAFPAL